MNKTLEQLWREFRAEPVPSPGIPPAPAPQAAPVQPAALPPDRDQFFSDGPPRKPVGAGALQKVRLNVDQVIQIATQYTAPSKWRQWTEQRRMVAQAIGKGRFGRRGIPHFIVETMYRDYQALGSLSKVARLYHRTRQSIWSLFHDHGLQMNERKFGARIIWQGRVFTPTKGGYFRATDGEREPLHHAMCQDRTGRKVPAGWQVSFRNGDNTDFRFSNLLCAPIRDVSLQHYRRRFPDRANMTAADRDEFWRAHNRDYMRRKAAAFKARGLRSDGKPRRRSINLQVAA